VLAKQLLNTDFTPLHPGSTISAALAKMDAWHSSSIPVVEPTTRKVIGQVLFDDIAMADDESLPLSAIELRSPVYTFENQHVFEVARKMLQYEVRLLAVVNSSETYTGIIEKRSVLESLSEMLNITTAGSVITVELQRADFTLSELVHLIETEGAKILGLTVEQPKESESVLHVSIKLSHIDTSAIMSSLQRHGYSTVTENRHDLIQSDLSSRADELIRYLDV
jgi:CBS domain-containing protein